MNLTDLGYDARLAQAFLTARVPEAVPARVVAQRGNIFRIHTGERDGDAVAAGKLRHSTFPAVGDFVAVREQSTPATIELVLPRTGAVTRSGGSERAEQVLAANVDVAVLLMGLDKDYNPRRLERFLALAFASDARPVVVLSKADLCSDVARHLCEVRELAVDLPVLAMSLLAPGVVETLSPHLPPGRTAVLLGSSGVGKSTLINRLLDLEVQRTNEVRSHDDRGRHTTTHRELFRAATGALIIDTPGLRELELWDAGRGIDAAFPEIEVLGRGCRFSDCAHEGEPGCAVRAAVDGGQIKPERLASYEKLKGEVRASSLRQDPRATPRIKRKADKSQSRALRRQLKETPGEDGES